MKKIINTLKTNNFLKIYIILISLINIIYVFFSVIKSQYIEKNSLGNIIEKNQFEYLTNMSN